MPDDSLRDVWPNFFPARWPVCGRSGWRLLAALALAGGLGSSCAPPDSVSRGAADGRRRDAGAPEAHIDPFAGWMPPASDPPAPPAPEPAPDGGLERAPPGIDTPPGNADAASGPGELLNVSYTPGGSATIDLGQLGSLDWVHFGFQGENAINRKRDPAAPLILMAPLGPAVIGRSNDRFSRFLWSDGKPVQAARNVVSGFETGSAPAGGFQVSVQGDPGEPRTVRLFVGAEAGAARLTARLGAGSLPGYVDRTLTADSLERNRVYTVLFRPADAQRTLTLEWTIEPASGTAGNVRIQAVTLAGAPPTSP
jgi:hypothetical protein